MKDVSNQTNVYRTNRFLYIILYIFMSFVIFPFIKLFRTIYQNKLLAAHFSRVVQIQIS